MSLVFHRALDLPELVETMQSNVLVEEIPELRRGHKTLISAPPKLGKTTLIRHMVVAAMAVVPVLILTEDTPATWVEQRGAAEWGEQVDFVYRFDVMGMEWAEVCGEVTNLVKFRGHGLVVIDTFYEFSRVDDENSPAKVAAALRETNPICDECGAAILLSAHARKGGGRHGEGVRGTNAFTGAVDVFVEVERVSGEGNERRRLLRAEGRFDVPAKRTMELSPDGEYRKVGDPAAANLDLPEGPPGLTEDGIIKLWRLRRTTVRRRLDEGCEAGRYQRGGKGKRGDPLRYWKCPAHPTTSHLLRDGEGRSDMGDSDQICDQTGDTCLQGGWSHGHKPQNCDQTLTKPPKPGASPTLRITPRSLHPEAPWTARALIAGVCP